MILWLLKLTKPIFQVKLHKTTSLVTKVCSVSSNYSKWCKFQIRIIRVSRSWISLLLRQGFFCCRNSSLGESFKPLEGVVDEDPVFVGLPRVVVGGSGCNKLRCKLNRYQHSELHSLITVRIFLPILRATSGKSSKLEVSSMELTWTGMAAGLSLMWSQSTPLNQATLLMSSRLWIRSSRSSQNLHSKMGHNQNMGHH